VLVDTSVWIDHLRNGNRRLEALLEDGEVRTHPFVVGELACGNLKNRDVVLLLLRKLPAVVAATDDEALAFVERHRLMGTGIGWIDAHLLAAAALTRMTLWTLDGKLARAARRLDLSARPS
jgi:predicted nucleic acid-binding protein